MVLHCGKCISTLGMGCYTLTEPLWEAGRSLVYIILNTMILTNPVIDSNIQELMSGFRLDNWHGRVKAKCMRLSEFG